MLFDTPPISQGSGAYWNFNQTSAGTYYRYYLQPEPAAAAAFPTASVQTHTSLNAGTAAVYANDEDGVRLLGYMQGGLAFPMDDPAVVMRLPLAAGVSWVDTLNYLDANNDWIVAPSAFDALAHGTLAAPTAVYPGAILVRERTAGSYVLGGQEHTWVEDQFNFYADDQPCRLAWAYRYTWYINGTLEDVYSSAEVLMSGNVGLDEEPSASGIHAWPVPTDRLLQVSSRSVIASIAIADASGRLSVRRTNQTLSGNREAELDLGHLAPGAYQLIVGLTDGTSTSLRISVIR